MSAAIVAGVTLDWSAYQTLRPALARAITAGAAAPIAIDLSQVETLEPAGIGVLVVLREQAARHRSSILLHGVHARWNTLLRDCGLQLAAPALDLVVNNSVQRPDGCAPDSPLTLAPLPARHCE